MNRFNIDESLAACATLADPQHRDRSFAPALLVDNPHLSGEQYFQNLLHLPWVDASSAGYTRQT